MVTARPPGPTTPVPKQIHLDLDVEDLGAAVAAAERLGAVAAQFQPAPGTPDHARPRRPPVLSHDGRSENRRGSLSRPRSRDSVDWGAQGWTQTCRVGR